MRSCRMNTHPGMSGLTVEVEKLEGHKVKLDVSVEPKEVARAYERAYRRLAARVSIPGFRKGKAPRPVLERHVGSEALREEALDLILGSSYSQALDLKDLEPIDRPEVEIVSFEEGEPFVFRATVEVKPEVRLGTYKGLGLTVEPRPVEPADIERQLDSIRERFAELEPVGPDAALEDGLFAVIDFRGTIEGAGFPGGESQGVLVQLGAGQLEAEFEEALRGARAGETKRCSLAFPEQHQNPALAGKTAEFEITVKEVKRKKLPELSDELAREVAGVDLAALRERVSKGLQTAARREAQEELARQVVEKVVAGSETDVPELLVSRRVERKNRDIAERLAAQNLTVDRYLEMVGLDKETWEQDLRARAEHEIRRELVLDAIARRESIQATDAEVEFEIARLAVSHGQRPEKLRELIHRTPGQLESLREGIIAQKTVQYLVSANGGVGPEEQGARAGLGAETGGGAKETGGEADETGGEADETGSEADETGGGAKGEESSS